MKVTYIVVPYYLYAGEVRAGLSREFVKIEKAVEFAKALKCDNYVINRTERVYKRITRSPPILDFKKFFEGA